MERVVVTGKKKGLDNGRMADGRMDGRTDGRTDGRKKEVCWLHPHGSIDASAESNTLLCTHGIFIVIQFTASKTEN